MTTPVCVPQNPAQPDQAIYGLSALETVPTYTRQSYLAAFGVQAPNFNASEAPKYWFDSTVDLSSPSNVAVYDVPPTGFGTAIVQLTMPAAEAAAVNIPGLMTYPAYVIPPTGATISGQPINPNVLSNYQDGVNLAASWGLGSSAVVDTDYSVGPFIVSYPATETRRQWSILLNGTFQNVGICFENMYANGVGAPGAWNLTGANPIWVPTPNPPDGISAGVPQSGSEVPVPVRPLLPNEEIIATLAGTMIARTDMSSAVTNTDGFGAADRATLLWIQQALQNSGLSS